MESTEKPRIQLVSVAVVARELLRNSSYVQEQRLLPAVFFTDEDDVADVCALVVEEWFPTKPADLLLNLISDSVCSQSRKTFADRGSEFHEAFQDGLNAVVDSINVVIVTSGLEADSLVRSFGHVVSSLEDERRYISKHAQFIAQQESDWHRKSLWATELKLFAFNSRELFDFQNNSSQLNSPLSNAHYYLDANHTHVVLAENLAVSSSSSGLLQSRFSLQLAKYLGRLREASAASEDVRYVALPTTAKRSTAASTDRLKVHASLDSILSVHKTHLPIIAFYTSNHWRSLEAVAHFIDNGVPIIIFEGLSVFGDILGRLYRASVHLPGSFLEDKTKWLEYLRRSDCLSASQFQCCGNAESEKNFASWTLRICSKVRQQQNLLSCWVANEDTLRQLPFIISSVLLDNMLPLADSDTYPVLLSLLCRINQAELAVRVPLPSLTTCNYACMAQLFEEALLTPTGTRMVKHYLDHDVRVAEFMSADFFLRLFRDAQCRGFFDTVILGHMLGYPEFPYDARRFLRVDLNFVLQQLTGFKCLIPITQMERLGVDGLTEPIAHRVHDALVLWAVMFNRAELAKVLWAYSAEPLALALLIVHLCTKLCARARDWSLYETQMQALAHDFASLAVDLLEDACEASPHRAYDVLCYSFESLHGVTAVHLAHTSPCRKFIAHDCCQRWTSRLLYGRLLICRLSWGCWELQSWLKVLLSAVFVLPMWAWVRLSAPPVESCSAQHDVVVDSTFYRGSPTSSVVLSNHRPAPVDSRSVSLEPGRINRITQSNCSVASLRSYGASASVSSRLNPGHAGLASAEQSTVGAAEVVESPQNVDLAVEDPSVPLRGTSMLETTSIEVPSLSSRQENQVSGDASSNQHVPNTTVKLDAPVVATVKSRSRKRVTTGRRCCCSSSTLIYFYTTPVAKYWLSLVFRVAFLCLLAVALAEPYCGSVGLDLAVWLWAFIAWTDACLVLYWKYHSFRFNHAWTHLWYDIADICIIGMFLVLLLVLRIIIREQPVFSSALGGRAVLAFFLLYMSYTTLFTYIPMSQTLGPLLVRVKLMVVRDLIQFLILVTLVICSCSIVIHAVIYPDYPNTVELWRRALYRAWFALFLTDVNDLHENAECTLWRTNTNAPYCLNSSPYVNPSCPVTSGFAYFFVVQFLVIVKLIAWPLLFALFAKTAKEVDEEADAVWKNQFYELVNNFSMRPPMPPPLTPLVFLFLCCSKACSSLRQKLLNQGADHPDVGNVYFGSVLLPTKKRDPGYATFWRRLAKRLWERKCQEKRPSPPVKVSAQDNLQQEIEALRCQVELLTSPGIEV